MCPFQCGRRQIGRTAVVFTAALLAAANSHAQDPVSPDSIAPLDGYQEIAEQLQGMIQQQMAQKNIPAFSIALVDGDQTVWAQGFGYQDAARQVPATAKTVYRVGSVSKLFTDIAIMQQVEKGALSLDAPITDYLPGFSPKNPWGPPITLRQLMSHGSGLVRESPVGNYFDSTEPTLRETVGSLDDTTLVYEPGTRTKYSNAGIAVVGYVLQRQMQVPFARHIEQTVLKPLGMQDSSFQRTSQVEGNLAAAWMWTYDGRRFPAPRFALGTAPAGNLYSSVLDLSRFLVSIFREGVGQQGRILKAETIRQMAMPQPASQEQQPEFGIGFHMSELDGHRKIGHGGAVYGFSTQLEALPDQQLGVAAVATLDGSNGLVQRIADHALRLLLARREGQPLPSAELTEPIPAELARAAAGRYASGQTEIELTEDNSRLFLRRGSFRYELRKLGEDLIVDDVLAFGPPVTLEGPEALQIEGRRYTRLSDQRPEEIPPRWDGLIGEYGWDHNTLYILEERGRLVALIEWFYYYPLTELDENTFAFPDYGLYHGEKLYFSRGADGRATQVVAAEVTFPRRDVGTLAGETFRIQPIRPVDQLRTAALAAQPPNESGEFRPTDLVDLTSLDPTIKLDIRYATNNNFMGEVFYRQPRALMQRPAAEAVVRAHRRLVQQGYGLLIHDAYRPWHVTKMFWDATPEELKHFVANPADGSRHNRGCAVDLTLYDLATGTPVQMVAGYDEFSPRSYPAYPGGTSRQRWHRDLLRRTMEAEGFSIYEFEWWHFDYKDWRQYRIGNTPFEEIESR
jgi:CubicO group peptidase (beta-lactamase class C family)/D-alanyl-D-alanine dipeptidase